MSKRLQTRLAQTVVERRQLIGLRTAIYREVGKHLLPGEMADRFDECAVHIGVWQGGRPIATARVLILPASSEWEHDRFLPAWPDDFPPRAQSVEMSRLCILRGERSLRTFRALCRGIAMVMIPSQRRYVVACCTRELEPLYRNFFGATFTGHSIVHSDLGPKVHRMFHCDMHQIAEGRGVRLRNWAVVWANPVLKALLGGDNFGGWQLKERLELLSKCALCAALEPLLLQHAGGSAGFRARVLQALSRPARLGTSG